MGNSGEDQGVKERIKAQLLEATNDDDLRRIRQDLKDRGEKPGSIDACVSELRRKGHLNFGKGGGELYPIKIGKGELIPPELALRGIQLEDGTYRKGFTDGMAVLILAARYSQLLAASQAEVLTNQLRIMEEGRKGSAEVAQEAAARAAAGMASQIMPEIQALKGQIVAQNPNPMAGLMVTLMEPAFKQAAQQIAGMFMGTQLGTPQAGQPQADQAGQPQADQAGQSRSQQPGPQAFVPPNVEIHRREELGE